jgi:predicted CoA-binding protein
MVPAVGVHQNVGVDERALIEEFLEGEVFAVAGASPDRAKYGNKVLRCYMQAGREVIPVNPRGGEVEGLACVPDLQSLGVEVDGLSIITPGAVTEALVEQAAGVGISRIWVQPGAEFPGMAERCAELGISCIWGGACLLVVLGFLDGS